MIPEFTLPEFVSPTLQAAIRRYDEKVHANTDPSAYDAELQVLIAAFDPYDDGIVHCELMDELDDDWMPSRRQNEFTRALAEYRVVLARRIAAR